MMYDHVAPRISACVCTRNRPEELAAALHSLERSSVAVDEIVVSDDSTNSQSKLMVERGYPHVRYIEGPRRGRCANRNFAASAARGTHVLFIEDDARLGKTVLAGALRQLELTPLPERSRTIVTGPEGSNGLAAHEPCEATRTIVINGTLFPIEALRRVAFDEKLVYGWDEVDFATRAIAAGFRIVPAPHARDERSPAPHARDERSPAPHARDERSPAPLNRDDFGHYIDASRLYVTFKRYFYTDKRPFAALCFAVVSPLQVTLQRLRRMGIGSLPGTLQTLMTAYDYVIKEAASRRTELERRSPPKNHSYNADVSRHGHWTL